MSTIPKRVSKTTALLLQLNLAFILGMLVGVMVAKGASWIWWGYLSGLALFGLASILRTFGQPPALREECGQDGNDGQRTIVVKDIPDQATETLSRAMLRIFRRRAGL